MIKDTMLDDFCRESGMSREQLVQVATVVLKRLHKVSVCDEESTTAAIMDCMWSFGDEACYHLGGILEEARQHTGPEGDPWTETYLRFAPDLKRFRPVLDGWMDDRTEARKRLDKS